MKPRIEHYEREEEEIDADFHAGLISRSERDRAVRDLWREYRELSETSVRGTDYDWE